MQKENLFLDQEKSEFKVRTDDFLDARRYGVKKWISKHIFYRSNKYYLIFWFIITLLATLFMSFSKILLGLNINSFDDGIFNWEYLIWFAILSLFHPIFNLFGNWLREVLAQRLERDTRNELYLNLLGKSQSFHDEQRLGDLMARATYDVRQLNYLVSPALSLIIEGLLSVIITIFVIALNYPLQLTLFPIIFNIFFIIALKSYVTKYSPVSKQRHEEFGALNSLLDEYLSGIEVIKNTAKEKQSLKIYRDQAKKYAQLGIKEGVIQAWYLPSVMVAITITLSLAHSVILYYNKEIFIGDIIAYMVLINNFFIPTNTAVFAWAIYSEAIAGAERIVGIMNQSSEIGEEAKPIIKKFEGRIEFQNVSFYYPRTKNRVLKNISFKIDAGQTVAIVGTTGSGKTTCTKLLSRLYDVSEGKILIDGIDIKQIALQSLRNQIAYIEQDVFLFSKSIYENIAFGRNSSKEEIIQAAKEAQAHDFIMGLPQGYDTLVGERGVKLSGGERQRIAIARAFLSNPRILILDDSTSAIDSLTEGKIQEAMFRILENRTTFLITHRLSQIRWADRIIVFHQGQIVAIGSHFELLKISEEYRNIFLTRFDKTLEELLEVDS